LLPAESGSLSSALVVHLRARVTFVTRAFMCKVEYFDGWDFFIYVITPHSEKENPLLDHPCDDGIALS
jgi:hypothetical protein